MVNFKQIERVKEMSEQYGSGFENYLGKALASASWGDQEKIMKAFPDFVKKFDKSSLQFMLDED